MISFGFLVKQDFAACSEALYAILRDNMRQIALEEVTADFQSWLSAVGEGIKKDPRRIVLIHAQSELIGFFQFYVNNGLFMMEEIQIVPEWQGKAGVFRELFGFVLPTLPPGTTRVEAYASRRNTKAQQILRHMGLLCTEDSEGGQLVHFRGKFKSLLDWHSRAEQP